MLLIYISTFVFMNTISIKRVYEPEDAADGFRVLIDKLWPRGMAKAKADIAFWAKFIAPSTELREWFGHKPENFPIFVQKYTKEPEANPETESFIALCERQLKENNVTLLYGAKDEVHNQAVVLKNFIETKLKTT